MNLKPIDFAREILRSAREFVATIISLLDVDFYKFTMGQFIFTHYRGVHVTFKLIVRSKDVHMGKYISEKILREHLDHARTLRFTSREIAYLRNKGIFREDYLEFLSGFQLPPYQLVKKGDDFELIFSGPWEYVSLWETIGLAMLSELYYRALLQGLSDAELEGVYARAQERIRAKLKKLLLYPSIHFTDFGQRRRHGRLWQEWVVGLCKEMMGGQFIGTSNVSLAQHYDIPAIGTIAHEPTMAEVALADSDGASREAPYQVLKKWEEMYGQGLRIMLPDTYTSESFFAGAPEWLTKWRGARQDSGDPITEGELYIKWYQDNGIDPKDKVVLFTDGLDVDPMIALEKHFLGRINTGYGWGTLLTNDFQDCYVGENKEILRFLNPFSMVCKVVEINGRSCVKLSNNPSKATGPVDEVLRYKKIFGVGEQTAQAVFV